MNRSVVSGSISPRSRRRLRVQGYECPNEQSFRDVIPWTRFSPALCSAIGAIGTILASRGVLAALGTVFRVHPFDLIYNHGIRYLTGTEPLPENGAPRRFACGVATVWVTVTAAAFWTGAMLLG